MTTAQDYIRTFTNAIKAAVWLDREDEIQILSDVVSKIMGITKGDIKSDTEIVIKVYDANDVKQHGINLQLIMSMCGNPDPAQACRNIINYCREF